MATAARSTAAPAPHHHQYAPFQASFMPLPPPIITMGAYEDYTAVAAASNHSPASHTNNNNSPDFKVKQLMSTTSCGRDDAPPATENVSSIDLRPPSYKHLPTPEAANCESSSGVEAATQSAAATAAAEGRIRDEQGLNEWPAMQTLDPQVMVAGTNINIDNHHAASSSKGGELAGEGGAAAVSSRFEHHPDRSNNASSAIHDLSLRGNEMDFWGYQK